MAVVVKFKYSHAGYSTGEEAGFSMDVAKRLVAGGYATYVRKSETVESVGNYDNEGTISAKNLEGAAGITDSQATKTLEAAMSGKAETETDVEAEVKTEAKTDDDSEAPKKKRTRKRKTTSRKKQLSASGSVSGKSYVTK